VDFPDGLHEIPVPGCPIPGYDSLRFGFPDLGRIRRIFNDIKPDVLYIATEGPLGWATRRVARQMKIPMASGYHTNFQQYLKHYNLPFLEMAAMSYMRRFHNGTELTFIPSPDLKEGLEKVGFKNLELLGRGVDLDLFSPEHRSEDLRRSWGAVGDTPVVLYVGRLAAEKNLNLLLKAFRSFRELRPDALLVLVGDGPERQKLEKECPEGLFLGPKVGRELAAHYASADCFFFPSVTETFGNVVTEALASGLLVFAYDYAAPALFIESGRNGFTRSLGNGEKGYLELMAEAVEREAEWPSLRQAARQSVQGQGWPNIAARFAGKLESIIAPMTSFTSTSGI
jgi:glycosyltransferase involved in cell wall biosynthesis